MAHRVDFIDGLPSPVFNLCKPQLDEKGDLWLGNAQGLLFILPDSVDLQPRPAWPVQVTDILVNNRSASVAYSTLWQKRHIDIDTDHPTLTFRFSDFQYTLPSCLEYQCRLDGHDDEWQTLRGKAEITYYNLPWGDYTLHLRRPGDNASETTLSVHVPMPTALLVLGLTALAALLAAAVLLWLFIRHRRADNQLITVTAEASATPSDQGSDKYQSVAMSQRELQAISRRLDKLMRTDKPYLNPDLRIGDLAERLEVSQYVLSFLFNQHLKVGYYDYVNRYRIDEFKQCVLHDDVDRYTLDALALRCGFSSRTSFFRYFKKAEGLTPSEYIRLQRNEGNQ